MWNIGNRTDPINRGHVKDLYGCGANASSLQQEICHEKDLSAANTKLAIKLAPVV